MIEISKDINSEYANNALTLLDHLTEFNNCRTYTNQTNHKPQIPDHKSRCKCWLKIDVYTLILFYIVVLNLLIMD